MPIAASYLTVEADGAVLSEQVSRTFVSMETESTYNRPDSCVLTYSLQQSDAIPPQLDLGKPLKVKLKGAQSGAQAVIVFDGEVTAVETEFTAGFTVLIVQAHDKLHRLFRGDRNKTYLNAKASDVASQLAQMNGLRAEVTATSVSHKYLMQHNESDALFLERLAGEVNHYVRADGEKLVFEKVGAGDPSGITLRFGEELVSFNTRATTKSMVKETEVRGWDVTKKQEVVGSASGGSARLDLKVRSAANGFGAAKVLLTGNADPGVGHLNAIAAASVERSVDRNLQAEGECFGEPKLRVDQTITIDGIGDRFSGVHRLSHVRHVYDATNGYRTFFTCRGGTDQSLANLVGQAAQAEGAPEDRSPFDGVAVGIVTNNDDPDGIGRVKVKFPHIAGDLESHWYRTVHPGAGGPKAHGWYLLPEVNDEVLVAFERSDPRIGYVVGGLFNGKDKPPLANGVTLASGKVNQHVFSTKTGAVLLFDDKDGSEAIEITSKKGGKFQLRFEEGRGLTLKSEADGNSISITPDGKIAIKFKSDISIESNGKISLKAAQDLSLEGMNVKIKATADVALDGVNVKANGSVGAEVKGGATAKLESSGPTTVKGAMVMIN